MSSVRLMRGGCLRLMKEIENGSVDMVLADPPYGTTRCFWDTIIPFEPLWEQLKRVIKSGGAIVMMAIQPFTSALIISNVKMFKYCWVWNKKKGGNPLISKIQPIRIHEDIVVFGTGRINYHPIMVDRVNPRLRGKNTGEKSETTSNAFTDYDKVYTQWYPKSILEISNANQEKKVHPTQKPVALMEYLIKTYTKEGETVLDFCMGSGTTGVACKKLNRNFIGIEIDKFYFGVAKLRIKETDNV